MGNTEQPSEPPPSSSARAEQVFCTLACTVLAVAVILCLIEQGHEVQLPRGLYAILASGIVIGGVGWTVVWSVSRAEARVAAGIEADQREMLELTSTVQDIQAQLAELPAARPKLGASCRVPGVYASRASQGETVGIPPSSVDGATDPAGVTLQRAREDGIETGFEIGYRAQLAERGVTSIPRPRRSRLTGDS